MSISLKYQGLPPDSGFVECVRSGEWHASAARDACSWLSDGIHVRGDVIKPAPGNRYPYAAEQGEPVWNWCCEAVGRFPGLQARNLDVHKSYQWLPFVLSAKVRRRLRRPRPEPADPRSSADPEAEFDQLTEQAFDAAPQIAPAVTGTQGLPIRLMEQSVVNDFGLCVGAMEQGDISRRISEVVTLNQIGGWDVERCTSIFSAFRQFFVRAAASGEAVLVVWE